MDRRKPRDRAKDDNDISEETKGQDMRSTGVTSQDEYCCPGTWHYQRVEQKLWTTVVSPSQIGIGWSYLGPPGGCIQGDFERLFISGWIGNAVDRHSPLCRVKNEDWLARCGVLVATLNIEQRLRVLGKPRDRHPLHRNMWRSLVVYLVLIERRWLKMLFFFVDNPIETIHLSGWETGGKHGCITFEGDRIPI